MEPIDCSVSDSVSGKPEDIQYEQEHRNIELKLIKEVEPSSMEITSITRCFIPVCPTSFRKLVEKSDIFIDKSMLIEALTDLGTSAIISRPRKWGKTTNLSMIKTFYEIEVDDNGDPLSTSFHKNRVLFEGGKAEPNNFNSRVLRKLKIADNREIMKKQGKHPVIYITFPKIGSSYTIDKIENLYRESFYNAYLQHINTYKKELQKRIIDYCTFKKIENGGFELIDSVEFFITENNIRINAELTYFMKVMARDSNILLSNSLSNLITFLYNVFNKASVYVLIDEFDAPLNHLFWTENFQVMNELQNCILRTLKNNECIEQAILIGCYPLHLTGGVSDINTIKEIDITNSVLVEYFGFTENEVDELLGKLSKVMKLTNEQKTQLKLGVKDWYNGYLINNTTIYNPFSIMNFLKELTIKKNIEECYNVFWAQVSDMKVIKEYFKSLGILSHSTLANLIACKYLNMPRDNSFDPENSDSESFLKLLVYGGYLTKDHRHNSDGSKTFIYRIPNKEVLLFFYDNILPGWLCWKFKIKFCKDTFMEVISESLENKIAYAETIERYLLDSMGNGHRTEADFQAVLVGFALFAGLKGIGNHSVHSEVCTQDSTKIDSLFLPISGKSDTIVIHEYKKTETPKKKKELLDLALWQIYISNYIRKALDKQETSCKFANYIVVRAIVFFISTSGKWHIEILEIKHTIYLAMLLREIFNKKINESGATIHELKDKKEERTSLLHSIAPEMENLYEMLESFLLLSSDADISADLDSYVNALLDELKQKNPRKRKSTPGKSKSNKKVKK